MDTQDSKTMQNNSTKVFTGVAQCDIMISEVKSGNKRTPLENFKKVLQNTLQKISSVI